MKRCNPRSKRHTIQDLLERRHDCYILITCDAPSESGEIKVEMSYKGDPNTAAYLLEDAHSHIREEGCMCPLNNKIVEIQ